MRIDNALDTIFGTGAFGRSLFRFPADIQLMIDDVEFGIGNADGFETLDRDEYIGSLNSLPCMKNLTVSEAEAVAAKRIFHIPSVSKTDVGIYDAVYRMRLRYGIRKFILIASGIKEREELYSSLSLMREHYCTKSGGFDVSITMFDSEDSGLIRNYAVSDSIEILLINRQFFVRPDNIVNRVHDEETGRPIDIIAKSRPVVLCCADDIGKLKRLCESAEVFDPLITLCLTQTDRTVKNMISFSAVTESGPDESGNETDDDFGQLKFV